MCYAENIPGVELHTHLLSALEKLYIALTCPQTFPGQAAVGAGDRNPFVVPLSLRRNKKLSPAYVAEIDIKIYSGDEGRGGEETNLCMWDCACKDVNEKNTKGGKQPWMFVSSEMSVHHSDKHCNADSVHSLTFRGIFHQISNFLYAADGRGKTFH